MGNKLRVELELKPHAYPKEPGAQFEPWDSFNFTLEMGDRNICLVDWEWDLLVLAEWYAANKDALCNEPLSIMGYEPRDTEIVKIDVENWQEYKQIRLEALRREPQAFGASYAGALKKPDEEWISRVEASQNESKDIMLFAKADDRLVGMIGAYFNNKINTENVANIWGVYVNEQYRGKGVGKRLMQELLSRLSTVLGLKKVRLTVNKNQTSAVGLYQAMGFEIVGNEIAVLGDGNTHEEYIFEKSL